MSYLSLMPWTLQKRLLRYLLSQLDFLETDDLDLENLGITWGQRSVVQLRDVGLKAKKLSSVLRLPDSIHFLSARIWSLKLTIPADILTSGIAIEISDVELRVKLGPRNGQEYQASRRRQYKAPGRGTTASRSQRTSPTVHDAGEELDTKGYRPLEEPLLYPDHAAQHLAESFLQSESRQGRLELQAAIESQSRHGRNSPSSSIVSDDEVGVGLGEGYALPSFIASYLVGITDRMQLSLKGLTMLAEFGPSQDDPNSPHSEASRPPRLLLRVSELSVDPVNAAQAALSGEKPQRKVYLHRLDVLVLSDSVTDSPHPGSTAPGSPAIEPLGSNVPSVSSSTDTAHPWHSDVRTVEGPEQGIDRDVNLHRPLGPESVPSYNKMTFSDEALTARFPPASLVSSVDHPVIFLASSQRSSASAGSRRSPVLTDHSFACSSSALSVDNAFQGSLNAGDDPRNASLGQRKPSLQDSDASLVDNQIRAEDLPGPSQIARPVGDDVKPAQSVEDLTVSKIFTHDQAASMYLSAMGSEKASEITVNRMPGGWDWSGDLGGASDSVDRLDQPQRPSRSTPRNPSPSSATFQMMSTSHTSPLRASTVENEGLVENRSFLADLPAIAKQLLLVDCISVWLPTARGSGYTEASTSEQDPQQTRVADSGDASGRLGQEAIKSRILNPSIIGKEDLSPAACGESGNTVHEDARILPTDLVRTLELEVQNIRCWFDLPLGKTLIALVKSNAGDSGDLGRKSRESSPSFPTPGLSIKVHNLEIELLENVLEQSITASGRNHPSQDDELLLKASFSGIQFRRSFLANGLQQSAHLRRATLSHPRGQCLSFTHPPRLSASVIDTDVLQRDDVDISVTSKDGTSRIEIHTRPMGLTLELGQMDDILSRSGGLSSLLELGSSIASSNMVPLGAGGSHEDLAKARGVRFAAQPETEMPLQDDFGVGVGKINFRMEGLSVDIIGSECSLRASTSAVKVVHRTEGMGLQISRILLEGPFLSESREAPQLSANLQNIRIEYLPTPSDQDLDRLLTILTPSKDRYDADDDIMLDTLLRQRRKGGLLRVNVESAASSLDGTSHLAHLSKISSELSKLSTVAKYLPEDDRPGILSLGLVKTLKLDIDSGDSLGKFQLKAQSLEGAHVNVPSLLAAQVSTVMIDRNQTERLLGESVAYANTAKLSPMIMCRFVADEMDPTVKVKLFNICVEYHVSFIAALQNQTKDSVTENPELASERSSPSIGSPFPHSSSHGAADFVRKTNIAIAIRDSALGLNPRDANGKALFLLTDAVLSSPLDDDHHIKIQTEVRKASLMVVDKLETDIPVSDLFPPKISPQTENQEGRLLQLGFVTVAYVSSATTTIDVKPNTKGDHKAVEVELGNALLIIETCADSTQTLVQALNGLSPMPGPVDVSRYRTEIMPIEDLLASFTGDAFITESGPGTGLRAADGADDDMTMSEQDDVEYLSRVSTTESEDDGQDQDQNGDEYEDDEGEEDGMSDSVLRSEMLESELDESTISVSVAPASIEESAIQTSRHDGLASSLLDFREDHFANSPNNLDTSRLSPSPQKVLGIGGESRVREVPLKVRVRDVHVIWNLYDGYDWQSTRDVISDAVKDIEARAASQRPRKTGNFSPSADDEEESVIGDFLFNSVYIGIPVNRDPRELAKEINHDIDDRISETGSYTTSSTVTGSPDKRLPNVHRQKKLKLTRSKRHKMTFELQGLAADVVIFPPSSGEIQNSIDFRVKDLEVFDHIPTSTWKKFATYMRDAGEREANSSMIHVEIQNVKPVPDLAASEMKLKVTLLPLRLHVDQDAVDFLSRFFEFKSESASTTSAPSGQPFLQRVEVNPVKVKLDFKPKRVDYGGLRSGRTTEFMNFFVLDQADMVLRRVILYGVSGFDRLGTMLNNIWMPDVKRNQLPGVLAGLAPIRSLVNVGSGVKDLVVVPMREYRKDGRVVRSIQKGALAFAKTTSKELVTLGAKLAIGTQTVLQTAETMLAPGSSEDGLHHRHHHNRQEIGAGVGDNDDSEEQKQISLYADQPVGVVQGLRGAYASLERDLLLAKDAIIAVPGEAVASGSATGAAKAVLKQAPTVILRPAIGASKAVGQTLLGAGNTLDKDNYRRVEEAIMAPAQEMGEKRRGGRHY